MAEELLGSEEGLCCSVSTYNESNSLLCNTNMELM